MPVDKLMRVDEVSVMLDKTRDAVYRGSRRGVIPAVRIGRSIRWSERQLRAWIEAGGTDLDELADAEREQV